MAEDNYAHIELKLPEETRIIPYNKATEAIDICDGIWVSNALYRIQGSGAKTQADGSLVRTMTASTPQFFNETARTQRIAHPTFLVHDLDAILEK